MMYAEPTVTGPPPRIPTHRVCTELSAELASSELRPLAWAHTATVTSAWMLQRRRSLATYDCLVNPGMCLCFKTSSAPLSLRKHPGTHRCFWHAQKIYADIGCEPDRRNEAVFCPPAQLYNSELPHETAMERVKEFLWDEDAYHRAEADTDYYFGPLTSDLIISQGESAWCLCPQNSGVTPRCPMQDVREIVLGALFAQQIPFTKCVVVQ